MSPKILFSACLLGEKVRYDGEHHLIQSPIIKKWTTKNLIVTACPEVLGGLAIPRLPAEISLLQNKIKIVNIKGEEVTDAFNHGAEKILALCQKHSIKIAIMTDGSPSCGSSQIYDGSFSGKKRFGKGLTVQLLEKHGIKVFSHLALNEAEEYYQSIVG